MGQHRCFSFSKPPPVLLSPSSTTNTVEREPSLAGWGTTAVLSFGGISMGLVNPSREHQAGHAPTLSLHLPVPTSTRQCRRSRQCHWSRQHQAALPPGSLKRTPRLSYSRGKWPETIQNLPCPSTHQSLPFCYLAPKGWKKLKTKTAKPKKPVSCDISNSLWDLKHSLQWQSPLTDKHFQLEIGLGARKNVCMPPQTYRS